MDSWREDRYLESLRNPTLRKNPTLVLGDFMGNIAYHVKRDGGNPEFKMKAQRILDELVSTDVEGDGDTLRYEFDSDQRSITVIKLDDEGQPTENTIVMKRVMEEGFDGIDGPRMCSITLSGTEVGKMTYDQWGDPGKNGLRLHLPDGADSAENRAQMFAMINRHTLKADEILQASKSKVGLEIRAEKEAAAKEAAEAAAPGQERTRVNVEGALRNAF